LQLKQILQQKRLPASSWRRALIVDTSPVKEPG
jgi:hypothetical protein